MFWSDEGGEAGEIDDLARLRIAGSRVIGVGAKRKGRRDGAAVWMMRAGCGGAVVRWCSVDGCASPAVCRGRCEPVVEEL